MDEATAILKEMLKWIRAGSFSQVEHMLLTALPDSRKRIAYQAIDGSHTIDNVKKAAGMGYKAVNDLIDRCIAMGLMEKVDGKPRRSFDLRDFGLLSESGGISGEE